MSTKARLKRTSPVLLLLGVLVIGAGAAYILWWQSGVVTHQVMIYGLEGLVIPGTPSAWQARTVATTLGPIVTGDPATSVTYQDSVLLSILGGELSGPIRVKCVIDTEYTGTITANAYFACVGWNSYHSGGIIWLYGPGSVIPEGMVIPTDGTAHLELTQLQAQNIFWDYEDIEDPREFLDENNCLLVEFTFAGGFSGYGTSFGLMDINITFEIEGSTS